MAISHFSFLQPYFRPILIHLERNLLNVFQSDKVATFNPSLNPVHSHNTASAQLLASRIIHHNTFRRSDSPQPPVLTRYLHALPHGSQLIAYCFEVRPTLWLLRPTFFQHASYTVETRIQHVYRGPGKTPASHQTAPRD